MSRHQFAAGRSGIFSETGILNHDQFRINRGKGFGGQIFRENHYSIAANGS